ncbi:hypothetical protein D7003_09480 [Arthrobacter oryzae]|uniref:Uncharacterized protein n=1 Tax=Arthrobacter oryzae TaxID=409290 RepID=A0A3N0C1L1_9MICC|nr:hypothetical protein D7003_09480 [Arthrobacter oryzae]
MTSHRSGSTPARKCHQLFLPAIPASPGTTLEQAKGGVLYAAAKFSRSRNDPWPVNSPAKIL